MTGATATLQAIPICQHNSLKTYTARKGHGSTFEVFHFNNKELKSWWKTNLSYFVKNEMNRELKTRDTS